MMRYPYLVLVSSVAIVTGAIVLNTQQSHVWTQNMSSTASAIATTPLAQADQGLGNTLAGLNLTDSQINELQAVKRQYQPLIEEQIDQSQTIEEGLQQLLAGSSSDTELRTKFQEIAKSQQQLMQIRLENVLAIRTILTPEQRQQLIEKLTNKTLTHRQS